MCQVKFLLPYSHCKSLHSNLGSCKMMTLFSNYVLQYKKSYRRILDVLTVFDPGLIKVGISHSIQSCPFFSLRILSFLAKKLQKYVKYKLLLQIIYQLSSDISLLAKYMGENVPQLHFLSNKTSPPTQSRAMSLNWIPLRPHLDWITLLPLSMIRYCQTFKKPNHLIRGLLRFVKVLK